MKKAGYFLLSIMIVVLLILSGNKHNLPEGASARNSLKISLLKSVSIENQELREISGLAVSDDGRLFGHNDEKGIVYEINRSDGAVIRQFFPGNKVIKADFEGIAIVDDFFYLVTSGGEIFEFREGRDDTTIEYNVFDTGLPDKCDVEGLCYDPETDCLLLACKGYPGKGYEGSKSVYSFDLKTKSLKEEPRFLLPEKILKKVTGEKDFSPSGIERNPVTGAFFIISARARAIIEISKAGEILRHSNLGKKVHEQPEGITFTPNHNLVISDEGRKKGKLTLYEWEETN